MAGHVAGTVAVAVCCVALAACTTSGTSDAPKVVTVEVILTGLQNPRGVALDAEGGLLVAEAGSGNDPVDSRQGSLVFNRIVSLRDAWVKVHDEQGEARP